MRSLVLVMATVVMFGCDVPRVPRAAVDKDERDIPTSEAKAIMDDLLRGMRVTDWKIESNQIANVRLTEGYRSQRCRYVVVLTGYRISMYDGGTCFSGWTGKVEFAFTSGFAHGTWKRLGRDWEFCGL